MENFLTDSERKCLRLQHKKEKDRRICDRIKAVLLYDKGWTYMQIADALLLTDEAIRHHISEYKASKKLKTENKRTVEKLSFGDSKLLQQHLNKHTYLYVKDIVAYVKSVFKINYTVSGMTHWLRRNGFSYKKPSLVPGKANAEAQAKWILEYKQLKQNLSENETICFMDGVHPTHNTQVTYGWIKKGLRKELAANSGRSRLNLTGALDLLSKKMIIQEDKTLNAESTLNFLKKIEEAYPTKTTVHLFCDNAGYYRNKSVKAYLETSKIKLYFLPAYSPNLNPIERVWKWMKERVMYNTYYEEFEDFKHAIIGFLEGISLLDPSSELGQAFARRVKDNFSPIDAPAYN